MAFSTGGRGRNAPLGEINVTPLVDVMLVLLIIFMVAAPMLTTGVEVDLPNAQAPAMENDEDKMILSIDATGKIFLMEDEVPLESLEARLRSNAQLRENSEIYVQADSTVPYGSVVAVLAIVRKVGIEKMGLITDPMSSEEQP